MTEPQSSKLPLRAPPDAKERHGDWAERIKKAQQARKVAQRNSKQSKVGPPTFSGWHGRWLKS